MEQRRLHVWLGISILFQSLEFHVCTCCRKDCAFAGNFTPFLEHHSLTLTDAARAVASVPGVALAHEVITASHTLRVQVTDGRISAAVTYNRADTRRNFCCSCCLLVAFQYYEDLFHECVCVSGCVIGEKKTKAHSETKERNECSTDRAIGRRIHRLGIRVGTDKHEPQSPGRRCSLRSRRTYSPGCNLLLLCLG